MRQRSKTTVVSTVSAAFQKRSAKAAKGLAALLNRNTAHLSIRAWTVLLIIFCITSAITFGSLLAAKSNQDDWSAASKMQLRVANLQHTWVEAPDKQLSMPSGINSFRQFMDSLEQTPRGKMLADSLRASRPGLLDSLSLVERMYE
jgi:hypothetical protein